MPSSRNNPGGIEQRTMTNLEFVNDVFESSPDKETVPVHIVTQIVNSLLGLVILPYVKGWAFHEDNTKLEELFSKRWPRWDFVMPKADECQTLGNLVWHLRNAAAHGNYSFSSNDRDPTKVIITVRDRPVGKPINWIAQIRADKLYVFCERLSGYMAEKHSSKSPS